LQQKEKPAMEDYFKSKIRNVNNFPKPGIVFRDITTLLQDTEAFTKMGEVLYEFSKEKGIQKVVGIDSRGFIYGGYLADRLNAGLVLIRKKGKLPSETIHQTYDLEYGTDTLEIHKDAIKPGEKVLVHDDLLATGGTAKAACQLIEKMGGIVSQVSFMIELSFLNGRQRFGKYDIRSAVNYTSE
jgi:adenine phosphoribosyltransferase